mmetsp:Transcript_13527/g.18890  ORF Transcript_13527/g.18890 Transcript_13527/m.18890 type:complete len:118 (-) Transcript_13527:15-368(-)
MLLEWVHPKQFLLPKNLSVFPLSHSVSVTIDTVCVTHVTHMWSQTSQLTTTDRTKSKGNVWTENSTLFGVSFGEAFCAADAADNWTIELWKQQSEQSSNLAMQLNHRMCSSSPASQH